eukprot:scaffold197385_cov27-Tisochrysis_lutea.AAC.2
MFTHLVFHPNCKAQPSLPCNLAQCRWMARQQNMPNGLPPRFKAHPNNIKRGGANEHALIVTVHVLSRLHVNRWRRRLQNMSQYFHAYRIDHILGFFRIWEIPGDCVTGVH